jgi:hypothetical protein
MYRFIVMREEGYKMRRVRGMSEEGELRRMREER